ncbi:MAG: ABC transporter permease [Nanoarchaeota archaeon]|nr:ABC transporter permease [Nanoarchaeota archaeon]
MLTTVLKKESKQLFSDKGFLLIALLQPIIFIIMFGSSFQEGDINHLKTIVIDEDHSNYSSYVVKATESSDFFNVVSKEGTLEEAMKKLNSSEIRSIVYITKGFEKSINEKDTGNIIVYIDSSNFLTYTALKGAKIEVAKDTLKNVTMDILGELEEQKETGKKKITDVKKIFEDIEKKNAELDKEIDRIKNQTDNETIHKLSNLISDTRISLNSQLTSLLQTEKAFYNIIQTLSTLQTNSTIDESKKIMIINQMTLMINEFNSSREKIKIPLDDLNDINVSKFNSSESTKKIEDKLKEIKNMFEDADKETKDINLDFENLEKDFLSEPISIKDIPIHGPLKYFDYLAAGVLSLIVFFVCLMAPALNVISEKEENTLYRLSTTPASSFTIFFGKFLLFICFGFIEMAYTLILAMVLYGLRITGSFFSVIFILSLLACSSIAIGLFISSKVKTMQQALVIVPVIVIPSFLISNAFFPPDIMAYYMTYVSYITPMTYSNHALNSIMIKGFTLGQVLPDIIALLGFTIIPLIWFIWSFKKIRY